MKKTKNRILVAGEKLIAEKGIAYATVGSVAREVKIADSLIYKYFSSKEDLLFSIAYQRMDEATAELAEQLQGIKDPESRLRKMIWYSLRYNDLHPAYARILLFEVRSNKGFYFSPGYQIMRKHAAITMDILKQGVADGIFQDDIDMRMVRDIIYGTLDLEAIGCIAASEIERSIDDFDDIVALILNMITIKKGNSKSDNWSRILMAAEKVFARDGFSRAKVSEIAKLAGVGEGTIYDYFKNKEDLILSIPAKRFQKHLDLLSEVFQVTSPLRKLEGLIRSHFTTYLLNREFLKIFLLDIQFNMRFYHSAAYDIFRKYLKIFEDVIEEGKAEETFRSHVNPRVFRNMFLGAFSHLALRWFILGNDKKYDKTMEINHLVNLLSSAVLAAEEHVI
jgi:TetR/AcrR family fatty acid metabolism transcriptional regulator